MMTDAMLEVRDLSVKFRTPRGVVGAVDRVSYQLNRGEAIGIVGESGSGKTVSSLAILRLFGLFDSVELSGQVMFEGRDLLRLSDSEMRKVRGKEIGMIFQDPLTSLNPVMGIGDQVAEPIRRHTNATPQEARRQVLDLLERVGIPDAEARYKDRPHSFSGGMRQRIMVAIAVACRPKLLIADEPTTALDVTVQAQILKLLDELRREMGMALVMITHDFGVVAATCDKVMVMYAARPLEQCSVSHLFDRANHPYTEGLLRLVPRFDHHQHGGRLHPIEGQPPELSQIVRGCVFAERCSHVEEICRTDAPVMIELGRTHSSACHFAKERARRMTPPGMPWREIG
jgi:oligopeptide/dipeptide ABC transporter ATP-binding protein